MSEDQSKPTDADMLDAVFGAWDIKKQKRRKGLIERVGSIEFILKASVPILVAKALGVPTDIFSKVLAHTGLAYEAQRVVAFFVGFPK